MILVAIAGSEEDSDNQSNFYNLDLLKKVLLDDLIKANTETNEDNRQLSLNHQLYPDDAESHKIINHPVHIFDQTLGHLSPSSFIPFCDFGGNKQEMGMKIKHFYSPICNSFHTKILNDNLCYEVDPNRFIDAQDPWAMSKGLTLFIDTNLERQYPKRKVTTGKLSSFSKCLY